MTPYQILNPIRLFSGLDRVAMRTDTKSNIKSVMKSIALYSVVSVPSVTSLMVSSEIWTLKKIRFGLIRGFRSRLRIHNLIHQMLTSSVIDGAWSGSQGAFSVHCRTQG